MSAAAGVLSAVYGFNWNLDSQAAIFWPRTMDRRIAAVFLVVGILLVGFGQLSPAGCGFCYPQL